jgi:hypothetical protein
MWIQVPGLRRSKGRHVRFDSRQTRCQWPSHRSYNVLPRSRKLSVRKAPFLRYRNILTLSADWVASRVSDRVHTVHKDQLEF